MPSRSGLLQLGQGSLNAKQSPFLQHGHEECLVSGVWLWQKRWEAARLEMGDPWVAEGDLWIEMLMTLKMMAEVRQSRADPLMCS